ncbi:hypothetical protein Y032_0278g1176 [Ancylostoma ceylanicum]|uniref:Uncharacterized protein n=1 Tax=Ancylostoma ceylanicum TaxID=53326 RepID=A0A016S8B9_9BILA|nr:hypothetical protein Y032_0278g1176 [Ancylostoma ceylanicum]
MHLVSSANSSADLIVHPTDRVVQFSSNSVASLCRNLPSSSTHRVFALSLLLLVFATQPVATCNLAEQIRIQPTCAHYGLGWSLGPFRVGLVVRNSPVDPRDLSRSRPLSVDERSELSEDFCEKLLLTTPERFKSRVYRKVVRAVALYGSECWAATMEVERRFSGMEMKMPRWMAGITLLDRICNQDIRQRFGVAPITGKLREARLQWCGQVLRGESEILCKIGLKLGVTGKRPKERLRQRWMDTLHTDLKTVGMHPDQAHDRTKWRQGISKADPATKRDKR